MRKASSNFLFAMLLLLIPFHQASACLESINPVLGANPSFFDMNSQANKEIYNWNISVDEKFHLLVYNTFQEAPLLPSIRNYNLLLPFFCPPNGTEVVDKTYIHNAWVRAITIMPSIMDYGNYWALPQGEVLVASNYSIQLPRSATNAYPDCGVVYTLLNSNAQLSVYANGNYIGNSTLTEYMTNSTDLKATAELLVSVNVRKDYYVSDCYCCKSGKNGCEETCCSCAFSKTEVEREEVTLDSSLDRKVYRLEASPNLTMLQCPNSELGVALGNLSLNTSAPVQSVSISFGDANSSLYTYELDLMTVLKPHNVLEAQVLSYPYQLSQNMFISEYKVSRNLIQLNFTGIPPEGVKVPYAGLIVTDLFGIQHNLTNYTPVVCPVTPQIELRVPMWAEKGSEFHAIVSISADGKGIPNKKVTLYYCGKEFTGITNPVGKADFELTANQSTISAESSYDGKYAEVSTVNVIAVYEHSLLDYFLSILAFLFILVLSYIAFRFIVGGER